MPGGRSDLNEQLYSDIGDTGDGRELDMNEPASFDMGMTDDKDTEVDVMNTEPTTDSEEEEKANAQLGEISKTLATPVHATGSMTEAHRLVEEKKAELLDTRVTRFFIPTKDGERITAVKRSIRNLYDAMYYDMPKDKEGYAEQLMKIRGAYTDLIQSCDTYISYIEGSGKGKKGTGKIRLDLTREIMDQSIKEQAVFELPSDTLYEDSRTKHYWAEMFDEARSEFIPKGEVEDAKAESEERDQAGGQQENENANRQISSSRIAEKLGMQDMVARAERESQEESEATEGSATNNVTIEAVAGKTMAELIESAGSEGASVRLADSAIGKLYQLQIFDLITGQRNRTVNDYVPTYEKTGDKEYTITSIKAINNVAEFNSPNINLDDIGEGRSPLTDSQGRISVPFLPWNFYDRVMSFDPFQVFESQRDVLNNHELLTLGPRISRVQNELKTNVDEGRIKLLYTDRDWREARDELVDLQRQGQLARSYIPLDML